MGQICSMCNSNEEEDIFHFAAKCEILKEFRLAKAKLDSMEVIKLLNGNSWIHYMVISQNHLNIGIFL